MNLAVDPAKAIVGLRRTWGTRRSLSGLMDSKARRPRAVVSHISQKTSEIWGTRGLVAEHMFWRKAIVGLRPSFSSHVRWGERGGAPVDSLQRLLDFQSTQVAQRLHRL